MGAIESSLIRSDFETDYEHVVQDFCSGQPSLIERGLRRYTKGRDPGIEVRIKGGRIDLLAVDQNNALVVIEFKRGQAEAAALEQLRTYMKHVKADNPGRKVRGIIVAHRISETLRVGVKKHGKDITLKRYKLVIEAA